MTPRDPSKRRSKVLLSLSGGNAPFIAASLLKNQNYDVRAVHFQLAPEWNRFLPGVSRPETAERVKQFCQRFDIPLFEDRIDGEFEQSVVEPAVHQRLSGRRFEAWVHFHSDVLVPRLEAWRAKTHSDAMATGHRTLLMHDHHLNRPLLMKPPYEQGDETHLLARVRGDLLANLMLPLSEIPEAMMEKIASELGLAKGEPLPERAWNGIPAAYWNSEAFLGRLAPQFIRKGQVRSVESFMIFEHPGIQAFEVGDVIPEFPGQAVLDLQPQSRTVVIGNPDRLHRSRFYVRDLVWHAPIDPLRPSALDLQWAGQAGRQTVEVIPFSAGFVEVLAKTPLPKPAPGQVFVFYNRNTLVGSGIVQAIPQDLKPKET